MACTLLRFICCATDSSQATSGSASDGWASARYPSTQLNAAWMRSTIEGLEEVSCDAASLKNAQEGALCEEEAGKAAAERPASHERRSGLEERVVEEEKEEEEEEGDDDDDDDDDDDE